MWFDYAATRLEDVAARAGVTKGTIYFYFETKERVFEEVVRRTSQAVSRTGTLHIKTGCPPSAVEETNTTGRPTGGPYRPPQPSYSNASKCADI